MATEGTKEKALRALRVLVHCAENEETITYGELGQKIELPAIAVGRVLGHIRDDICRPRDLPLINAIVVRKDKGIPGKEVFAARSRQLQDEELRGKFECERDRVFRHEGWKELLAELGVPPL